MDMEERAGGYVSRITFNNGVSLNVEKNSIVVFVGPNNAGKSQTLKDIYSLSENGQNSVVVSGIEITKNGASLFELLDSISTGKKDGEYTYYDVLGNRMVLFNALTSRFPSSPYYGSLRSLFIAELNTAARLNICNPPTNIARNAPKAHPIHYAAFEPAHRKWLSDNFKKAFNVEVTPNILNGANIPLCIGEPVSLSGAYAGEQERLEAYAKVLSGYKQVQDQGDGIKSFTGILLYLMLDYFRTYLIDEPESFLHPPQARIMGQIIGETLSGDQQAFISTHSEDVVKGLLEACPERMTIVRITREGDSNSFSILDNEKLGTVWSDPLLKYSNIMSSLFHKTVVLCESDSDCRMYSLIEGHLKQAAGRYSETLFIHCGGKQRMARIASALRALDIDVRLIPDIDVMNDENVFRGILQAFGIGWDEVKTDYKAIVSNLHSPKEKVSRAQAKVLIGAVLDGSGEQFLSPDETAKINEAVSTVSKWKALKLSGAAAIPAGDAARAFRQVDQLLGSHGIYIVPVGELERFIPTVGGHGPDWTSRVLEAYPDLDDEVYADIKSFISGLEL
ncbi:MAG: ATP-dependent nuclease [Candidatus Scatomorpha sp.]|jgi:energy-coupling factor transporter ATP-binding protein EcfA2